VSVTASNASAVSAHASTTVDKIQRAPQKISVTG
jgi:hypothetical protein